MCCGGSHVTSAGVTRARQAWASRPHRTSPLRRWAAALDRWAEGFNARPANRPPLAIEAAPLVEHWPVTVVQLDEPEPLAIEAAPVRVPHDCPVCVGTAGLAADGGVRCAICGHWEAQPVPHGLGMPRPAGSSLPHVSMDTKW